MAQLIMNKKLELPDKLARIDDILKEGANLNGNGGKYGIAPLDAAIGTNDVNLVRRLIGKGMKLPGCPRQWPRYGNALSPGGDVMLDFLLIQGVRMDCLGEPPLHAFLAFGIAKDSYPVDQAIRVASVLIRHVAAVDQRDSRGRTIFDLLNLAKNPSRVLPLRDALIMRNLGGTPQM